MRSGGPTIRNRAGRLRPTMTKRFLELNLTNDSFDFQVIPGVVPNRGLNPRPTSICMACITCSGSATPIRPRPRKSSRPDTRKRPARRCISSRDCS